MSPHAIIEVEDMERPLVSSRSLHNSKDSNPYDVSWLVHYEFVLKEKVGKGSMGDYQRASWRSKDIVIKTLVNQKLKEGDLLKLLSDCDDEQNFTCEFITILSCPSRQLPRSADGRERSNAKDSHLFIRNYFVGRHPSSALCWRASHQSSHEDLMRLSSYCSPASCSPAISQPHERPEWDAIISMLASVMNSV